MKAKIMLEKGTICGEQYYVVKTTLGIFRLSLQQYYLLMFKLKVREPNDPKLGKELLKEFNQ